MTKVLVAVMASVGRMDLAGCRPSLAGRNQRVAEVLSVPVREKHGSGAEFSAATTVVEVRQRKPVSAASARQKGFRFHLGSGLLSCAIDAAFITAKVRRVSEPALAETKDGSSGARRGGGFGCTLPHSGFNPENGHSPVPEQACRPRAGSRQRHPAVDSHSFREHHQSSRSVCSRRTRHVVAHAHEEEHTASGEVLHRRQLGSAARW